MKLWIPIKKKKRFEPFSRRKFLTCQTRKLTGLIKKNIPTIKQNTVKYYINGIFFYTGDLSINNLKLNTPISVTLSKERIILIL